MAFNRCSAVKLLNHLFIMNLLYFLPSKTSTFIAHVVTKVCLSNSHSLRYL